jgi:hypothetical protein
LKIKGLAFNFIYKRCNRYAGRAMDAGDCSLTTKQRAGKHLTLVQLFPAAKYKLQEELTPTRAFNISTKPRE